MRRTSICISGLFALAISIGLWVTPGHTACDAQAKARAVNFDCLCPYALSKGFEVQGNCQDPGAFFTHAETNKKYCFATPEAKTKAEAEGMGTILQQAETKFSQKKSP